MKTIIQYVYEASVWNSIPNGMGLALESESYDKLIERIKNTVTELMRLSDRIIPVITILSRNLQIII